MAKPSYTPTTWVNNANPALSADNLNHIEQGIAANAAAFSGYVPRKELLYSVKDYGAKGDHATDDTAAIQAAITAAQTSGQLGTVYFPPGDYITSSTLLFESCSVWAPLAAIFTSASPAVQLGTSTVSIGGRDLFLPQVIGSNVAGQIGVQVLQATGCRFWLPQVSSVDDCVRLDGTGGAVSYNTINVGVLIANKRNLACLPVSGGWTTQNTVIGGRFTFPAAMSADTPGTRQVQMGDGSGVEVGATLFLGCSFEGDVPEYHYETFAHEDRLLNCRWEVSTGTPRVHWADDGVGTYYSYNNVIDCGTQAVNITATSGTYAKNNYIRSPGVYPLGDGTQASPSLTFGDDPDTGLYRASANVMHLVAGGQDQVFVTSSEAELRYRAVTRMRADSTGIAFYGHTTVAQQLLATGAGHTVDDVITALQNLGLLRQS